PPRPTLFPYTTLFRSKQQELVAKHVAEADLVITTALVIGKKAPVLVTEAMVKTMKTGSVIVDMAVESGGNCTLSEYGTTVIRHRDRKSTRLNSSHVKI